MVSFTIHSAASAASATRTPTGSATFDVNKALQGTSIPLRCLCVDVCSVFILNMCVFSLRARPKSAVFKGPTTNFWTKPCPVCPEPLGSKKMGT